MTFKLNDDQDLDAAYFQIEDKIVLESEEIADGIVIDYVKKNNEISSQVELNMGYQPFTLTPSPFPRTGEGSRIFPPSPVLGEGVRG